jgi:hypothetical protein
MKTSVAKAGRKEQGSMLVATLFITMLTLLLMAATMQRTLSVANLNSRSNQYYSGMYAAEAATEKVVAQLKEDYPKGGDILLSNQLKNKVYQGMIPTSSEDPYWANFSFTDGAGNEGNSIRCVDTRGWGAIQGQFVGLQGWTNTYRIISNARMTSARYNITNAVQQDIECDSIPIFQFAVFYGNTLMEYSGCATFVLRGRVHANGDIYVGSSANLSFSNLVTTTGGIYLPRTWGGFSSPYGGKVSYAAGYRTNVTPLVLPIGDTNSSGSNAPNAVRELINMPPVGGETNGVIASQRYYNNAGVVVLVSNSQVAVSFKNGTNNNFSTITADYSATNYTQVTSNFPFLAVTNTFYDQREKKYVAATQIDVKRFDEWLYTNGTAASKFPKSGSAYGSNPGDAPNIVYVADNRTNTASTNLLFSVRLTNSAVIPSNNVASGPTGMTLCTPNPLYVWGDYNCPDSAARGTTNTASTYPASLVSDALTILSANWVDSQSTVDVDASSGKNKATSTTVNAAVMTGVVYSTGSSSSTFSGGVMNLPRLLEHWGNNSSSIVLTLNTSIVNLFNSVRATNQFRSPGDYYYAPQRNFNFDQNFMNYTKMPPGTPQIHVILRKGWATAPANTLTSYAGY